MNLVKRERISVTRPFNENGFHFQKIREGEVMFQFDEEKNELLQFNGFENMSNEDNALIINVNPCSTLFFLL